MPLPSDPLGELAAIEGSVSESEVRYLHRLAALVKDGCIVEIGCFRGRSTAALAMGSLAGAGVPVYCIDPQEEFVGIYGGKFGPEDRGKFFEAMLRLRLYPVIRLVNLSSEWLSEAWPIPVRLLWIDGDHRHEGVRRDIDCWLPKLHHDATIVFDDALDPGIGPYHVIEELVAAGGLTRAAVVGKTATLIKGGGCGA